MTHTLTDPLLLRLKNAPLRMDSGLPAWARRSHPIVRRELGIYWKTLPLELSLWARLLALQMAVTAAAVPFPILYSFILPVITVSFILVPIAFVVYAHVLVSAASFSASAVLDERQNHTLPLLLVTPLSLNHIVFSKIAAAIWRNLDNLSLVMICHVLLSLPLLVLQYATALRSQDSPWLVPLAISLALAANMARLFLEPVLAGAVGAMMGACTSPRVASVIAACSLLGAYFAFLNLPRLLPLAWGLRLALEIGLPLVLPAVCSWAALLWAGYWLRRE